jgi:hypothetical protein
VVRPRVPVEDALDRIVAREVTELLDVHLAVGTGHQIGADRHEPGYAEPGRQGGDQLGHGWPVGHRS